MKPDHTLLNCIATKQTGSYTYGSVKMLFDVHQVSSLDRLYKLLTCTHVSKAMRQQKPTKGERLFINQLTDNF